MEIYDNCNFAPKFLVDDVTVWFPCDTDFVADNMVKENPSFSVETVDGVDYYPLEWLVGAGWFTTKFTDKFTSWALEAGVPLSNALDKVEICWITRNGNSPEYIRTIGFSSDGEVFIALDALKVSGSGLMATLVFHLGESFVRVRDYAEAEPENYADTILGEMLPALAKQHDLKFNEIG